ncbi:hypothetical protein B0H13DRAFT_1872498 [Mycena leptocephala]|nr:hypothetical protein B0H13DRAFT_1872498 [Mycena leptocephala]
MWGTSVEAQRWWMVAMGHEVELQDIVKAACWPHILFLGSGDHAAMKTEDAAVMRKDAAMSTGDAAVTRRGSADAAKYPSPYPPYCCIPQLPKVSARSRHPHTIVDSPHIMDPSSMVLNAL